LVGTHFCFWLDNERDSYSYHSQIQKIEVESYNVDTAIIEERNEEFKYLENELRGLNEMFVDIAVMIKDQGTMVDTIEQNTQHAVAHSDEAVIQLRKASEYQRKSRTKLCCVALILTLILAAIGIFLGIWFGVLKK
jgi:t-SNARE complex subunit (syntaxin)